MDQNLAIGSLISGDSVTLAAGRDLTTRAAQVGATGDVLIAAGNNLHIGTAESTYEVTSSKKVVRNGLMGQGGSLLIGQASQEQGYREKVTTPEGSLIGSTGGNVTLTAGNLARITGSDVLSATGTTIVGKDVTVEAALETRETTQTQKQKSAGITVGLSGTAVALGQTLVGTARQVSQTDDSRLKALQATKAGLGIASMTNASKVPAGSEQAAPPSASVGVQIGLGASSASSKTTAYDETARGSTIRSSGDVTIAATGGDLNIIGSEILGKNVALAAANNLNFLSQAEKHTLKSESKNAGGGVGIQLGTDGFGIYVEASAGKSNARGNGVTHAESMVNAENTLTLISGNDTTIKGAQLTGDRVLASIGGNLRVESEQDTDDYASKSIQAGVKVVYGAGVSGSASFNQSKVNSTYEGVNEVSGIKAGEGGFDITVAGNTHLKGGVIASTADASKNILNTGSLSVEHLLNKTEASSDSTGYGFDTSMVSSNYGAFKGALANALDGGSADKNRDSETRSDVAAGTIVVRDGNVSAIADMDRKATDLANTALGHIDLDKLQEKAELERGINGLVNVATTHFTDEAHRTMFEKDGGLYVVEKDEYGNPLPKRRVTLEEYSALKASADGKVHIANNGISTDLDGSERYAIQHSSTDGSQYFLYFPKADNPVSEFMVALYQDKLEGSFFGVSNTTNQLIDLMTDYGKQGLHLDGHSRGTMTIGNAMEVLRAGKNYGILNQTTMTFIGPAYKVDAAARYLAQLQQRPVDDPEWGLKYSNHQADVVGRWIGLNPPTGGTIPSESNWLTEMLRGGAGKPLSAHNCYGAGADGCKSFWIDAKGQQSAPIGVKR